MYIPAYSAETDPAVLHALMRAHPLGAMIVATSAGMDVHHLPFVLDATAGPSGVLRGHVARGNGVWQQLATPAAAVVIFQGPEHYISPSWYPSKEETGGKVVPTWNYVVVHAHGTAVAIDDRAWLTRHLTALVDAHEGTRTPRWRMSDAPAEFTERMVAGVVGIEIAIARLEGKWKLSQNRSEADRRRVIEALEGEEGEGGAGVAAAMRAGLGPPA